MKIKTIFLKGLRYYQRVSSTKNAILTNLFSGERSVSSCRYSPTCSQYTYDAIEGYGIVKGILLGVKRIMSCHPWAKGGHDPVPPRKN